MKKYLFIPYKNGGRDLSGLDCWGLVRLARADLVGKPLLPMLNDLDADDKSEVTKRFYCLVNGFVEVPFSLGAIACAFMGDVMVHVGLVVDSGHGRLKVLETDLPHGVSVTPIDVFESRYTKVRYYDD